MRQLLFIGQCMYPFLSPGDILIIEPTDMSRIKRWQILVFKERGSEKILAHRVIKINDKLPLTRGDGSSTIDDPASMGNIIGVVRGRIINGRTYPVTRLHEIYSLVLNHLYWRFFRRIRNGMILILSILLYPLIRIRVIRLSHPHRGFYKVSTIMGKIVGRSYNNDHLWIHPYLSNHKIAKRIIDSLNSPKEGSLNLILNPEIVCSKDDKKTIIFFPDSQESRMANEIGTFILGHCNGRYTRSDIAIKIRERFIQDEELIERDINTFLDEMQVLGVVGVLEAGKRFELLYNLLYNNMLLNNKGTDYTL